MISDLFVIAEQVGCVWKLEKLCRNKALKAAANKPEHVKLFLNVDGNIIQDKSFIRGFTNRKAAKAGVPSCDIVFEITERSDIENYQILQKIMMEFLLHYCNETGAILIAEGIETEAELKCLCKLGVHYGQGYFLGRPDRTFKNVRDEAMLVLRGLNNKS